MRGAIAAGHPATAAAGARILAEGGNAVDACIAAGAASWAAESPLAGPGGGGFMLVYRARDGVATLFDFFVAVPGLGGRRAGEMEEISVAFEGGESSQLFRIGPASCAVPGTALGLERVHAAFGSLPWASLLAPAIELARAGIEMTPAQAYLHAILDVILRHGGEGDRVYGPGGPRAAGERLVLADLADSIEWIAQHGARELYAGELARAIVDYQRANGGPIGDEDLRAYRIVRRRPVRAAFRSTELVSNPPPSSGGVLIGYGLRLLDAFAREPRGSAGALALLAEVMREQDRARAGTFASELYRGGLARRLLGDEHLGAAVERVRAATGGAGHAAPAGGTTHVSVIDADGNAASLSTSLGSGSGAIVPGTGIHLNNMLGESDLNPGTGAARPGARLTSMMAPSVVLAGGRPRLVVGSAGSARLRGAIMQAIVNVVDHGLDVVEAIDAPRVHVDEPHLHCEGGHDASALDELESCGYDVVRWRERNLYFGGVSAVELRPDGTLAAAGDPRRGGHGIVVG